MYMYMYTLSFILANKIVVVVVVSMDIAADSLTTVGDSLPAAADDPVVNPPLPATGTSSFFFSFLSFY